MASAKLPLICWLTYGPAGLRATRVCDIPTRTTLEQSDAKNVPGCANLPNWFRLFLNKREKAAAESFGHPGEYMI